MNLPAIGQGCQGSHMLMKRERDPEHRLIISDALMSLPQSR